MSAQDRIEQFKENASITTQRLELSALKDVFSPNDLDDKQDSSHVLGERLQHIFAVAHDEGTHRQQTNLVQQVREGIVDAAQLAIRVGGAEAVKLAQQIEKTRNEQINRTRALLAALDDILARQIADMEAAFDAENPFWREELAAEILDVVPERLDGESLEDYRERLEQALIDEMLDEDGEIKAEYQNNPKAQWAKMRHDHGEVQEAAHALNEDLSESGLEPHEMEARANQAHSEALQLVKNITEDPDVSAAVTKAFNSDVEEVYTGREDNDFLASFSSPSN